MEEHSEQYSKRESISRVFLYITIGLFLNIIISKHFLPWLQYFSDTAHCSNLWGVNAPYYLSYGVFAGIPIAISFIWLCGYLAYGRKMVLQKRYPIEGEKRFNKTKIVRGKKAVIRGYFILLLALLSFAALLYTFQFSSYLVSEIFNRDTITCY